MCKDLPPNDISSKQLGNHSEMRAYLILILMPLFFSTNIIIGRAIIPNTEPFLLACLRWGITGLILLGLSWSAFRRALPALRAHIGRIFILGFLGMWICGAIVYAGLKYTTASNGTLIYTASSVLIILLEWAFFKRRIGVREIIGVPLAITGVAIIVFKGSWAELLALQFNPGDGLFVLAAISWAVYSVLLKRDGLADVPVMPLLGSVGLAGAFLMLPIALWELRVPGVWPTGPDMWLGVAGLVVLSSLIPFTAFQYGVKVVGPSIAGVFLYLMPPFGIGLAVMLLGETLHWYHWMGFVFVLGGVVLATLPAQMFKRR